MFNLPGYSILTRTHEGAEYTSYQGTRLKDGLPISVKIPRSASPTPSVVAKLLHEYGIVHALDLPGVPKALALEAHPRGAALIFEELDAKPLADLLRGGPLDVATALRITAGVASILEGLHARHILHNNITPQSILWAASRGAVYLADFTLAMRVEQQGPRTAVSPDELEGNLAYMSPERTTRMNRGVDRRSDLYSLGVTLYEMLTGTVPFPSADPMEVVHGHIARAPQPVHERAPRTPVAVSNIVAKLLAKLAEDRYLSARGLVADLNECLRRLGERDRIEAFPLGRDDRSGDLVISQKLYGREGDLAALFGAFERASKGAVELVLVAGYSGIGKSALVQEIHKPIAKSGGQFISGKFDQLHRSVPYAPISAALRQLIRPLLARPTEELAASRRVLLDALGSNGQLLVDLVPDLPLVIGEQPSVQDMGPTESKNRFTFAFQRFVRSFTGEGRPLALFLDDLQWADAGSLSLLRAMLTDSEASHLLVIGAYRDNEVDSGHLLTPALEEIRNAGAAIHTITLTPLEVDHVADLLADSLGEDRGRVEPLARLVHAKTEGNPFFINQFLRAIHQDGLLFFDPGAGAFRWDLDQLRKAGVTDNVADLMARKLERLAEPVRRALMLAACVGHSFDLETLSIILERSPAQTAGDLQEAIEAGIIAPLSPTYRFLPSALDVGVAELASPSPDKVVFRFLHDRIEQAAYALIDEDRRQSVHLRIGRLMIEKTSVHAQEEKVFEITAHMNIGAALIEDSKERLALARRNLSAGKKARAAAAYQAAGEYFATGLALLGEAAFEVDPALAFDLTLSRAECDYSVGRFAEAEESAAGLLARPLSTLERLQVVNLRVVLSATQGRFAEALDISRPALALFGLELPSDEEALRAARDAALARLQTQLAGRSPDALLSLPELVDPERRALARLLMLVSPSAYLTSAAAFELAAALQVSFALENGNAEAAAYGYMAYALGLAGIHQRYAEAYSLGRMALSLNERFGNAELVPKLAEMFNGFILHFQAPLRSTIEPIIKGYETGLAIGDFSYVSYLVLILGPNRLSLGNDLPSVLSDVDRHLALARRIKEAYSTTFQMVTRQLVRALSGYTRAADSFDEEGFDERAFLAEARESGLLAVVCWFYIAKVWLHHFNGSHEAALAASAEAEALLDNCIGYHFTTELPFYTALSITALYPSAEPSVKARYAAELDRHEKQLAAWADICPENFRHRSLLVAAERARVEGHDLRAVNLYDEAMAAARKEMFRHVEARAAELAGEHHLAQGRVCIAQMLLSLAAGRYRLWGAASKTAALARRHGALLNAVGSLFDPAPATLGEGKPTPVSLLDATAAIRAAQTIASELLLPRIIERLMRIVATSAGAESAVMLLEREGKLVVGATLQVTTEAIEVGLAAPLEERGDLPRSLLYYVSHTREPLMLGDASSDERFSADPAVVARGIRAVFCLPLTHQGRLTGVLYMENNLTRDAFAPHRVEIFGVLASQAAVALENAKLVARLEAATAEIGRAKDQLEEEVAARTLELSKSNGELSAANERLQVELGERARAEQERALLQEQIISAQKARLAELSTPLIPITGDIMVMPLIGTLDADRAEEVLEVALAGAQGQRARVVIFDVTGVKNTDLHVANALMRAARALRLIGAEAILTGLQPAMAQALVTLGIDLTGIQTRSTLQSAITDALARPERRPRAR